MHGPPLVGWLLVALCAATGAYCLFRMRAGAAGERRAAGGDALMGLGMAVMAVPAAALDTRPWGHVAFALVFGAVGLRALALARGGRAGMHHLHHAVGAFAMVYMALAMAGSPGAAHAGHTAGAAGAGLREPAGNPLVTGLLLVYFAVYVVRTAAGMVPVTAIASQDAPWPGPPRERPCGRELTDACRLSMGIGMLAMLLTM
ncbi:DUF5134 domain-containing protein [Streptomyces griseocarneus]|uniref:DUF5134 domain-containing protein n=1 Tax=Streptomyces griseocarneus TaxID=51201 RepID=UPI00167ECADF|nr:DUF5134 domain-containing protein [Streptomyces griseocarneus]MBZ6476299.1 DUF5134 domain-containing protein [Streptomyces griseocarneus]GHG78304.1 DUF5134 domain-containing protein [Streptomyces griseocarneus]